MRKWICVLIAALLLLGAAAALAESDAWLSDWNYEIVADGATDDLPGYLKLTQYKGKSTAITVPGTANVDGTAYKVEIPAAQSTGTMFPESVFPKNTVSIVLDGVTLAPRSFKSFYGLQSLTALTFKNVDGSRVTNADRMFSNCKALKEIDLSGLNLNALENISEMFGYCDALKEIDLTQVDLSHVTDMLSAFTGCDALEKVSLKGSQLSNVTNAGGIFAHCPALKAVDLSDWDLRSATELSCLFQDCSALESVKLSGLKTPKVTSMNSLFSGCTSLKELDLSALDMSSIITMDLFFDRDTALEKIVLGPKFKFVYQQDTKMLAAFPATAGMGWKSQADGKVYTSVQILENRSGIADTYTKAPIPEDGPADDPTTPVVTGSFISTPIGVYQVKNGEATFNEPKDKNATSLTLPDTVEGAENKVYKVTAIKAGALKGMKKLAKVTIGKNVKTIGANAFNGCVKLKTVSGMAGVTTIGASAFQGCKVLAKITLPAKVKSIGAKAFYKCAKLKSIVIKSTKLTAKTVGANAFKGVYKKATVKVPAKKLKAYKTLLVKKGLPKTAKVKK